MFKGRRVEVGLLDVVEDFSVCRTVSLVFFHDIGEDVEVFRVIGKGFDRFERRERLESKFRQVAEEEFAVFGERFVAMPYRPVVHIPAAFPVWIIKGATRRWACRPVEGVRVMFFQQFRDDVFVHFNVIGFL